ncbi:MAG: hypoxanthine phosphoribosyltransferase [Bacteroidales bacterium]|nr:hypoxanthine phosphoribosyltransferase [Bacteroidales bacterium]MCI1733218.1 hypoxanthine phosphoribosyltransferase [Bacteroidales bacterium]
MKRIQLYDKCFKMYLPYAKIEKAIDKVAKSINEDLAGVDTPIFLGVLTGSFMFTADLMKRINFPCDIVFIRLASYEGTSSTGEVKQIMGLTKSVKDKTVIVVEDVVDTGGTIMEMDKILRDAGAKDIKVCTLLYKPSSYKGSVKIDYYAKVIPNDFIVGFGLDYNQLGRQYKDIYVLDEEETQKRLLINKK